MRRAGQFFDAVRIYDRLAREAYARERVRAGVQMDVEAARALLSAQAPAKAQEHALRALRALVDRELPPRPVMPVIGRVGEAMDDAAAAQFREQVDELLMQHGLAAEASRRPGSTPPERQGRLPAQCPACYAPLRSDEVDWLASDRAQCSYCGQVVLAT
jgi:hypothetical protein